MSSSSKISSFLSELPDGAERETLEDIGAAEFEASSALDVVGRSSDDADTRPAGID